MEFTFRIKVGATEITITENANSQREMFEKISFFSSLPTKAPNGADDLKIVYRKTKGGDEFYSIVSETEKQEYKFGIHKNAEKTLFPKGWEPLYGAQNSENEEQAPQVQAVTRPSLGGSRVLGKASQKVEVEESYEEEVQEAVPTPTIAKPKVAIPGSAKPTAPATPAAITKPTGTNPAVSNILNKYLNKPKA